MPDPTHALGVRFAELSSTLENHGHAPDAVLAFLVQCSLTFAAQDIGLLAERPASRLLEDLQGPALSQALSALWFDMAQGAPPHPCFGGPFLERAPPVVLEPQAQAALLEISRAPWRNVEPLLLGALLERALDPRTRHRLGAHFSPRAHVERLVHPALTAPLQSPWDTLLARPTLPGLRAFHEALATLRILDPACGTGNILCVALEALLGLEAALLEQFQALGEPRAPRVGPHQLLGLELHPRTAQLAELVLHLGHILGRAQYRTALPQPLLTSPSIHIGDALLGPDNALASWPRADIILANPPFIGTRRMRRTLGDGIVEALSALYPEVPDNADYVMYWWHRAATEVRLGRAQRMGMITTNSITQTFNRTVLQHHLQANPPLVLRFAIPDLPWRASSDGADVRVALTVADNQPGKLGTLLRDGQKTCGVLTADLRVGASPAACQPLPENAGMSFWGVKLYGKGFLVRPQDVHRLVEPNGRSRTRPILSGRDLMQKPRGLFAIDCNGLDENELELRYPRAYNHLRETVWPVRRENPRRSKRKRWWLFGENQPGMRAAIHPLSRYIATAETTRHRVFVFVEAHILPEGTIAVIASDDAFVLGVLSSRVHTVFATAAGGRLGTGNDPRYNKTRCFEPFPFPTPSPTLRTRIAELAEALEVHRRKTLSSHPELTMTRLYNAVEACRAGENPGHVDALVALHDALDAEVLKAYGWPEVLTDEALLEHVVTLNLKRAASHKTAPKAQDSEAKPRKTAP